jgi:ribosome biogenesis GTPase
MTTNLPERLVALGWDEAWEATKSASGLAGPVGRLVAEHKGGLLVDDGEASALAVLAGRLRPRVERGEEPRPAVGDWVVLATNEERTAHARRHVVGVLPRKSKLARKVAGRTRAEQVLAANVDLACVVSSLDADFNPARLQRYVALARDGGVVPFLLFTKADLADDQRRAEAARVAESLAVPCVIVSARQADGFAALAELFAPGKTHVLLGSSGVGKSTLLNHVLGRDRQRTSDVRDDGKGRHTTTHRELVRLPSGALVIDSPGMRELGLVEGEHGLGDAFTDIEELAVGCRFRDCAHGPETECAVRAAIEAGQLAASRLAAYHALSAERAAQGARPRAGRPTFTRRAGRR